MIKPTSKYKHGLVSDELLTQYLEDADYLMSQGESVMINPLALKNLVLELKHFSVCRIDGRIIHKSG